MMYSQPTHVRQDAPPGSFDRPFRGPHPSYAHRISPCRLPARRPSCLTQLSTRLARPRSLHYTKAPPTTHCSTSYSTRRLLLRWDRCTPPRPLATQASTSRSARSRAHSRWASRACSSNTKPIHAAIPSFSNCAVEMGATNECSSTMDSCILRRHDRES